MDKKDQNIIPSRGIQESLSKEQILGRWDEMTRGAAKSAPCTVSVLSTDYMESVID